MEDIMGKAPVKPNFIKEYNEEKAVQNPSSKDKQSKNNKPQTKSSKKVLIPIVIAALLLCLAGGAFILLSKTNIENNSLNNNSGKQVADISKQVEEEKYNTEEAKYSREAKLIWTKFSNQLDCTENVFTTKYVELRKNGASQEEAFAEIDNEYGKVFIHSKDETATTEEIIESVSENQTEIKNVPTSEPVKAEPEEIEETNNSSDYKAFEEVETEQENPIQETTENPIPEDKAQTEEPAYNNHSDMWTYDEDEEVTYNSDWGGNVVEIPSGYASEYEGVEIE